jgi:hypothetical protein
MHDLETSARTVLHHISSLTTVVGRDQGRTTRVRETAAVLSAG